MLGQERLESNGDDTNSDNGINSSSSGIDDDNNSGNNNSSNNNSNKNARIDQTLRQSCQETKKATMKGFSPTTREVTDATGALPSSERKHHSMSKVGRRSSYGNKPPQTQAGRKFVPSPTNHSRQASSSSHTNLSRKTLEYNTDGCSTTCCSSFSGQDQPSWKVSKMSVSDCSETITSSSIGLSGNGGSGGAGSRAGDNGGFGEGSTISGDHWSSRLPGRTDEYAIEGRPTAQDETGVDIDADDRIHSRSDLEGYPSRNSKNTSSSSDKNSNNKALQHYTPRSPDKVERADGTDDGPPLFITTTPIKKTPRKSRSKPSPAQAVLETPESRGSGNTRTTASTSRDTKASIARTHGPKDGDDSVRARRIYVTQLSTPGSNKKKHKRDKEKKKDQQDRKSLSPFRDRKHHHHRHRHRTEQTFEEQTSSHRRYSGSRRGSGPHKSRGSHDYYNDHENGTDGDSDEDNVQDELMDMVVVTASDSWEEKAMMYHQLDDDDDGGGYGCGQVRHDRQRDELYNGEQPRRGKPSRFSPKKVRRHSHHSHSRSDDDDEDDDNDEDDRKKEQQRLQQQAPHRRRRPREFPRPPSLEEGFDLLRMPDFVEFDQGNVVWGEPSAENRAEQQTDRTVGTDSKRQPSSPADAVRAVNVDVGEARAGEEGHVQMPGLDRISDEQASLFLKILEASDRSGSRGSNKKHGKNYGRVEDGGGAEAQIQDHSVASNQDKGDKNRRTNPTSATAAEGTEHETGHKALHDVVAGWDKSLLPSLEGKGVPVPLPLPLLPYDDSSENGNDNDNDIAATLDTLGWSQRRYLALHLDNSHELLRSGSLSRIEEGENENCSSPSSQDSRQDKTDQPISNDRIGRIMSLLQQARSERSTGVEFLDSLDSEIEALRCQMALTKVAELTDQQDTSEEETTNNSNSNRNNTSKNSGGKKTPPRQRRGGK